MSNTTVKSKRPLLRFHYILMVGLIGFHIWLLSKLQFTAWPEMLSYPYLINHGFHFYGDIIHPFVPLLPVILSLLFQWFGSSPGVLEAVTIITVLTTDILLLIIAKKLFGQTKSLVVLSTYIMIQVLFEGNGLWFDLAVTPFLLGAYLALQSQKNIMVVSAILSIALLIKLSTLGIIAALAIRLFVLDKKRFPAFLGGLLISTGVILFILFSLKNLGSWSDFFYWGIIYPLFIVSSMPGYIAPPTIRQLLSVTIILLPSIPILLFWLKNKKDKTLGFLLVFFAGSLIFTLHRFAYFHFQPVLPFLVLLIGYAITYASGKERNQDYVLKAMTILSIFISLIYSSLLFMRFTKTHWHEETRFLNHKVIEESKVLARSIAHNEPVFFYNATSQYFVLSQLTPTKPWADTFPWYLELPGVQEKIIDNLEMSKTEWIVLSPFQGGFNTTNKYELGSYRPLLIDKYKTSHFRINQRISNDLFILKRTK